MLVFDVGKDSIEDYFIAKLFFILGGVQIGRH